MILVNKFRVVSQIISSKILTKDVIGSKDIMDDLRRDKRPGSLSEEPGLGYIIRIIFFYCPLDWEQFKFEDFVFLKIISVRLHLH